MIVLPLIALLASLGCVAIAIARYRRHGRTHELVWIAAFLIFALGAGCEVAGLRWGWNPFLARLYYFTGATLAASYLALGTLFLLAPRRVAVLALRGLLIASAAAGWLIAAAPVDPVALATAGWAALAKSPALVALTVTLNAGGTAVVVGGAAYSLWRAWRQRGWRRSDLAVLLIAAGTLLIAGGGTLTRLGQHTYLYLAMAPGICLLLAGYLAPDLSGWPRRAQHAAAPARRPGAMTERRTH
ncbi:MAG TPA: hypothetical protein VKZ60_09425 [Chloroflexota bacterium]|nr:hypothetical protein [Chloroflexota bacterium]